MKLPPKVRRHAAPISWASAERPESGGSNMPASRQGASPSRERRGGEREGRRGREGRRNRKASSCIPSEHFARAGLCVSSSEAFLSSVPPISLSILFRSRTRRATTNRCLLPVPPSCSRRADMKANETKAMASIVFKQTGFFRLSEKEESFLKE